MIYVITEGAYSNYSIIGIYEGPPGLSEYGLKKRFIEEMKLKPLPGHRSRLKFSSKGFHEWLTTEVGLKLLDSEEINEQSYDDLEFYDEKQIEELKELLK